MGIAVRRLVKSDQHVQPLRCRIAAALQGQSLTASEIAKLSGLDKRTVYRAFNGTCELETYDSLRGVLGAEWEAAVARPRLAGSRLSALEAALAEHRKRAAAAEAEIARLRAPALATASGLRLVAAEDRP